MNKVKVEVYDNLELSHDWQTYPSDFEPADVRAQFEELQKVLTEEFGPDIVEALYIDITDLDVNQVPEVARIINYGHSYPVIVINERARFAGVVNYENIVNAVKKELDI